MNLLNTCMRIISGIEPNGCREKHEYELIERTEYWHSKYSVSYLPTSLLQTAKLIESHNLPTQQEYWNAITANSERKGDYLLHSVGIFNNQHFKVDISTVLPFRSVSNKLYSRLTHHAND